MSWRLHKLWLWCLFGIAGLCETTRAASDRYPIKLSPSHSGHAVLFELTLPEGTSHVTEWELAITLPRSFTIPLQAHLNDPRQQIGTLTGPITGPLQGFLQPVPVDRRQTNLPAATSRQYVDQEGRIRLEDDSHEILTYHQSLSSPPAGIARHYARSGHIHPLKTPTGQTLTAEFPADHAHQHGVFFAWVNTLYHGHKVDFWNQGTQLGTVRHARLITSQSGPVYTGFASELEHLDLTQGESVALKETWQVMATSLGNNQQGCHVVDIESRQSAASETPLEIQKYHYGGFGWRGPTEWLLPQAEPTTTGCQFLTSEGHDRQTGNHTRPAWVAVTGTVDGQPGTVAIFGHPSNFRHPQPVRLHPDKPYFCFAPCVLGEFTITTREPLISRYRIVTHSGEMRSELYTQLVQDWSHPIQIEFPFTAANPPAPQIPPGG
ncbi:MAG: hypothetical protein DWH91_04485 [Planctomycetota bacterium]|nr:MAG: hypothetical protein DWH91_04485 [Planctomycetota bacterium]